MDGYGSQPAHASPIDVLKRIPVILRLVEIITAIIVFGAIADQGTVHGHCVYNDNNNACGYGIAIGVIAFIFAIIFIGLAFLEARLSQNKRVLDIFELAFSGLWTFMWFVGFCFLTNQWVESRGHLNSSAAEAAIAFCFFNILLWGASTFFAFKAYRGDAAGGGNMFGGGGGGDAQYSTYQGASDPQGDSFAPPPFAADQSSYPSGGNNVYQ